MIEQYQFWQKISMIGIPIGMIIAAISGFGLNYYNQKIKEIEKRLKPKTETQNTIKDSTEKTTKNIHVQGDYIVGQKNTTSSENINASNALIVTNRQTGGQNTVNYYQNEYKSPNLEIENLLDNQLKRLASDYPNHPHINIEIETGNSQRHKVALQLEKHLDKHNLGSYPKGNTSMGRFPDYPISVFFNSNNKKYIESFVNAMKTYLISDYHFEENDNFPDDYVRLYINGQPSFDPNGVVKIN